MGRLLRIIRLTPLESYLYLKLLLPLLSRERTGTKHNVLGRMAKKLRILPSRRKEGIKILSLRRALLVVGVESKIMFGSSVAEQDIGDLAFVTHPST